MWRCFISKSFVITKVVESSPECTLEVGGVIRVQEVLGRGGSSVVCGCDDARFAVKLGDVSFEDAFDTEFAMLRELHAAGAHVLPAYAFGHARFNTRNIVFIVMDRGHLLSGGIDATAVLDVARDVATTLQFMHARGTCHCDVKPDNVLFSSNYRTACLIDFGIAVRDSAPVSAYTQTRWYRSPQLVSAYLAHTDATALDAQRADMWAFGCTLFQLCVGVPLFTGKNMQDMAMQHAARAAHIRDILREQMCTAWENSGSSTDKNIERVMDVVCACVCYDDDARASAADVLKLCTES